MTRQILGQSGNKEACQMVGIHSKIVNGQLWAAILNRLAVNIVALDPHTQIGNSRSLKFPYFQLNKRVTLSGCLGAPMDTAQISGIVSQ